jgi:protein-S-isoprenylcysteine O-methyltransferase Ste14
MNGFLLLIPFLLIRFGLLSIINKGAIKRASHFPPMSGNEILAYWIYQISNIAIFVFLFFLTVIIEFSWRFYIGLIIYIFGLILCAISVINFSVPSNEGFNYNGLYRCSRNPMYVSYLIYFVGCALLAQSLVLCGIVLIFQITSHWIILSEERWCIEKFGKEYKQYMKKVRRYI